MADVSSLDSVRQVSQWLMVLGLGSVAGAGGQLARVVVGLKKANDAAANDGLALADVFSTAKLSVSILLGAVAGGFVAIEVVPSDMNVSNAQILSLIAAGYAGSDFIEGFMNRYLPGGTPNKKVDEKKTPDGTAGGTQKTDGENAPDGSVG